MSCSFVAVPRVSMACDSRAAAGKYTYPNGAVEEGDYENGRFIGPSIAFPVFLAPSTQ